MIRVLEFLPKNQVAPIGGPLGYVYNLTEGQHFRNIEVDFLPAQIHSKSSLPKPVLNFLQVFYGFIKMKKVKEGVGIDDAYLKNYDCIHFHSTIDLYKTRKSLKNYKGKVLLTSHCPKPMHKEIYEDQFSSIERFAFGRVKMKFYKNVDEFAFDRADFILFPCEEAEEPYFNNWKEYVEIRNRNINKYRYILSGVREKKPRIDSKEVVAQLQLQDKTVFAYVGRHNQTKGYDILKKYGNKILSENDKAVFLVCGKEYPLAGLNNPRWIEIGWTRDADSYINVSTYFVLPNRETYFDLVMLEVLSLGTIVIASKTGGNRYFEKFSECGIFLYESDDEFYGIIDYLDRLTEEEKEKLREKNKELFASNFSNKIFAQNYENLILSLGK